MVTLWAPWSFFSLNASCAFVLESICLHCWRLHSLVGLVRSRLQNGKINVRLNSTGLLFVFFALTVTLKSGKWLVCFILCWLLLALFFRLKWNNNSIMNLDKQSLQVVIYAEAENHSEYCQSSFVNYVMLWVDSELCLVLILKANRSFWRIESVYELLTSSWLLFIISEQKYSFD